MAGREDYRRELGQIGEDVACEVLQQMGHTILERNWRSGHLEIDIISFNDNPSFSSISQVSSTA